MISHYREPIDIASSNFSEDTAIYGGEANLKVSIRNVISQYSPDVVAIPTTCLSETIGDDVERIVKNFKDEFSEYKLPEIVCTSTPSYQGTHAEGFRSAVKAIVKQLAEKGDKTETVNIVPGMFSPADLRYIKELLESFDIKYVFASDYSDTLDGPLWTDYEKIPSGGTSVEELKSMGSSRATIEFTSFDRKDSAGAFLKEEFGIDQYMTDYPIGVGATDALVQILQDLTGKELPVKYTKERGRLLDAMVDAHKHTFGVNAIVYGEVDLVVGLANFLKEIGVVPKICATGARNKTLTERLADDNIIVMNDADFEKMKEEIVNHDIKLMIGNSKGYKISREFGIPLVRVGFPIHDRVGGQRILHVGYQGAQDLFDKVVNSIIELKQDGSDIGYTYM
jgi:nitrogenase molybdenum-iron protein NifN